MRYVQRPAGVDCDRPERRYATVSFYETLTVVGRSCRTSRQGPTMDDSWNAAVPQVAEWVGRQIMDVS